MKAVFHFDNTSQWTVLSANITNIIKSGEDIEVCVVANSQAVEHFQDKELKLIENVPYYVCNNALNSRNIAPESLVDGVEVVPSGVVKIIQLQEAGYHYIKP
ncbi:hypothetical protein G7059_09310 [Erysipelothrix sp. HDW6A]|uniref:DsrE family protein n=1 Tax=Erysipelothrix sp. HDW6A TaxID=2714928 RepID=UPI0014083739|nr:DsrE family protein [Erysipelothrix sp. HDW6A]QIK58028.1 hypothetical protein G7059_09310 [Erysipelothrix sp. HDW6A]